MDHRQSRDLRRIPRPVWRFLFAVPLSVGVCASAAVAAPRDVIRTGGPSAPGDVKVAIIGSRADLRGERFAVTGPGGHVALRGHLHRAPGSAKPWHRAFSADLTEVAEPGSYRVEIAGLRSRPWRVTPDASPQAIRAMLGVFAVNRDGGEPSPAHGAVHLNDAVVASGPLGGQQFDFTGGWMDAGDMLHFAQTTAFASAVLQVAARLDPVDATALEAEADVGLRWLRKAHPQPNVFIAQVGDARDHERGFADPSLDDGSGERGIAVRLAYPAIGGDVAGKAAAALALAADRAAGFARDEVLDQARDWYEAGRAVGGPTPELPGGSFPGSEGGFYRGTDWRGALAAGAAALHRTTGERRYLDEALAYLADAPVEEPFGWDAFGVLAAADLCGTLGAPAASDPAARDAACASLARAGRAAVRRANRDAFGTPGIFTWGQTATNGGAGATAELAARAGVLTAGRAVASGARDYLLGRNPWGRSFVVGFGPRSPRHVHHWTSVLAARRPAGAVVGGPAPLAEIRRQKLEPRKPSQFDSKDAVYEDRRANYVTSEPALDYTAASILLLAALS